MATAAGPPPAGQTGAVTAVALAPGGDPLTVAVRDHTVRLFDLVPA